MSNEDAALGIGIIGCALITAGIFVEFGLAAGLFAAGVFTVIIAFAVDEVDG